MRSVGGNRRHAESVFQREMQERGTMDYRKNQLIELDITDLGSEGEGIGRTGAFLWFVKGALPGDRVRASVMKLKKSYGYARLQELLRKSPDRVAPPCPVAASCGGCSLQALRYEAQLKFKEQKVLGNLRRIGGLELSGVQLHPIIGMEQPFRYRNKAQFPVGAGRDGRPTAGFYAGRTHSIIPCEDCLLGVEENAEIRRCVLRWMEEGGVPAYDEQSGKGFLRHILVRKGFQSGEMMVCLVTNGECCGENSALQLLTERLMELPGVTTVVQNINTERSNVILGKKTQLLAGAGVIRDRIGSTEFLISAQSFYQVNPVQTERLYATALSYAGLSGRETVWDLYCGIGTISLFLARSARKVYGVEIIPQAIEDARRNAARNGITNAEFFVGKAEEVLPRQYEETRERADVIVVDPPRKGCDEQCLATMLRMAPERIVYVSCDSATLARDLKYLLADGCYTLRELQMVDMFPQTVHVECIALIQRVKL